jgi:hypothetical protein
MIVSWDKPNAGIKVIPAQFENNAIRGFITLLPGNNEVSDDLWFTAKQNLEHDGERKYIKEFCKEEITGEIPKYIKEGSFEVIANEGLESLDFDSLVTFLKADNLYKQAIKRAQEEEKDFNRKFILELFRDSGNTLTKKALSYFGLSGNTKYRIFKSLKLKEMKAQEALDIVLDTWNTETLAIWRKEESRDEIRAAISNQIELVNKPPKGKRNVG